MLWKKKDEKYKPKRMEFTVIAEPAGWESYILKIDDTEIKMGRSTYFVEEYDLIETICTLDYRFGFLYGIDIDGIFNLNEDQHAGWYAKTKSGKIIFEEDRDNLWNALSGEKLDEQGEFMLKNRASLWEEGCGTEWYFSREFSTDEHFITKIKIETWGYKEDKTIEFSIPYDELCYAIAKGFTDVIKKQGIFGWSKPNCGSFIDVREFLFLKAVGLHQLDQILPKTEDTGLCFSSFETEKDILLAKMD